MWPIVGLIPLFVLVWRAYSQPAPATIVPASTPAVTPVSGATNSDTPAFGSEVLVPNLIGRTQPDAEQLAAKNNLTLSVGAGRFDPKVPIGSVVAQNPSVGKKVAKGSAIEIALSQGPKVSPVANLINTIYEADVPALEPYGWDIRLVEEYNSQEPFHKVLGQDPAPGFQLAAGQPLTLMVSGGTTVTLGVNIDNQIWLDAANLPRDQVRRGEQLDATLLWRGQRRINTPYTVFIHFVGPDGQIVNQIDSEPPQPTTSWPVSATINVPYLLDIPLDAHRVCINCWWDCIPPGSRMDACPSSMWARPAPITTIASWSKRLPYSREVDKNDRLRKAVRRSAVYRTAFVLRGRIWIIVASPGD